jgi:5-(carboxyamino)imidazole ribonucleotide mutase
VAPLVAVLMGSRSDWETMSHTVETLERLDIPHEVRALSAHRTPDALTEYVTDVEARGAQVFVAAAGGAAHLAGVIAAKTARPVLGVPMQSASLGGLDSLLSMVQMPAGVPVATVAVGNARNAGLLAVRILAATDADLQQRMLDFQADLRQTAQEKGKKVRSSTGRRLGF